MKVKLVFVAGPDKGVCIVVDKNEQRLIGRGDSTDFALKDELISREHVLVEFDGKQLTLTDLGSTNHTFVAKQALPSNQKIVLNKESFYLGPNTRIAVEIVADSQPENGSFQTPETPMPNDKLMQLDAPPAREPRKPVKSKQPTKPVSGKDAAPTGPFTRSVTSDFDAERSFLSGDSSFISASNRQNDIKETPVPYRGVKDSKNIDSIPCDEVPIDRYQGSIAAPGQQGMRPGFIQRKAEKAVDDDYGEFVRPPQRKPNESSSEVVGCEDPTTEFCGPVDTNILDPSRNESLLPKSDILPIKGTGNDQLKEWEDAASVFPVPFVATPVSNFVDSIAVPGQIGRLQIGADSITAKTGLEGQSIAAPHHVPQAIPRRIKSEEEATTAPASETGDPTIVKTVRIESGVFLHSGKDIQLVTKIVKKLSRDMCVLYCVDRSRLKIDRVAPLAGSGKRNTPETNKSQSSNFISDDKAEQVNNSFSGITLFDWIPEGAPDRGPVLLSPEQMPFQISDAWNCDAMIIFFGNDREQLVAHLKKLLRLNIQNGRQSDKLLGICWPSILCGILECQPANAVQRIFGDAIQAVLLEDPTQEADWKIASLTSRSNSLDDLFSN